MLKFCKNFNECSFLVLGNKKVATKNSFEALGNNFEVVVCTNELLGSCCEALEHWFEALGCPFEALGWTIVHKIWVKWRCNCVKQEKMSVQDACKGWY